MWVNYNEKYAVSVDGLVMNTRSGNILEGSFDKDGYRRIKINGKVMTVHRLVGLCFLPRIDLPKLEIDHVNRDKTDNSASNLRWCDRATNTQNNDRKHLSFYNGRYTVQFMKYGKKVYHKRFNTLEEATTARDNYKLNLRL
jgi:hypothetical protein